MFTDTTDDDRDMKVVRNDEEQYSIWEHDRPNPSGWHDEGFSGTKGACLQHIESIWTDMRPRSLRAATAGPVAGQG